MEQLYTGIGCSQIVCKYWFQHHCLNPNCFQCLSYCIEAAKIMSIHKAKLNAGIGFFVVVLNLYSDIGCRQIVASIGCSIIPWIQSVSSSSNYCIRAKVKAGKYATKLNVSIGWRICLASIGCSINACHLSVSGAFIYCIKVKMDAGKHGAKLNAIFWCRKMVLSIWWCIPEFQMQNQ